MKDKMKYLTILFIVIANLTYSQIVNPLRFPYQSPDSSYDKSSILVLPDGDILFFWISQGRIYSSRSIDDGLTWSQPKFLFFTLITTYHDDKTYVSSILTFSGSTITGAFLTS